MKIASSKISCALLLVGATAYAGPNGPPPPGVPPPGLPIDGGVVVLAVAALCFGIYTIFKYQSNKKTSV